MKMDITFNLKERNGYCGNANIVFDEKYALENVQLKSTPDRTGFYVVTPEIQSKNGVKELFHPVSSNVRTNYFDTAIIKAYHNAKEGNKTTTIENDLPPMAVSLVRTSKYENGSIVGLANVGFSQSYMIEGVQIKVSQDGHEYLSMPTYRQPELQNGRPVYDENGKPKMKYRDVFKPITREAYDEIRNAVVSTFYQQHKSQGISESPYESPRR